MRKKMLFTALSGFLGLFAAGGFLTGPAQAAPAMDGDGIMSVSPDSVDYGAGGLTFTFTFSAGVRDFGDGSQVEITVPAGWTAPTMIAPAGLVTITGSTCTLNSTSPLAVAGATIFVDMTSCLAGQSFTLTYAGVTPPGPLGSPYTFLTRTDIGQGGNGLIAIAAGSPSVAVTLRNLTVEADAISKGLGMPDPPLTWRATTGSLAVGDTLELTREPGETAGAYPITVGSFPAAAYYNLTYVGAFLTIGPTAQFVSNGTWDGFVLESSQVSGVGGSVNASAKTARLGDDAANRQYRAILSFDTSLLPDNAMIQAVALRFMRSGAPTGSNPFNTLGNLLADIRMGTFGARTLTATDFQAAASAVAVGTVGKTAVGGWHTAKLNAAGRSKVNKTGLTQVRLYFQRGDNNNRRADFLSLASGNAASGQPQLVITYALP